MNKDDRMKILYESEIKSFKKRINSDYLEMNVYKESLESCLDVSQISFKQFEIKKLITSIKSYELEIEYYENAIKNIWKPIELKLPKLGNAFKSRDTYEEEVVFDNSNHDNHLEMNCPMNTK